MTRSDWYDLPEPLRAALEARVGTVRKAEPVRSSMAGLAARLHTEAGQVFLKAIRADDPGARPHLRERWIVAHLPAGAPAPHLLYAMTVQGWHATAWECLDGARLAGLSPGSPDLPAVLDTLARLGPLLTPAPPGTPAVIDNLAENLAAAGHVLTRPDLEERELYLAALDGWDAGWLGGDTLVHFDLSESTLLVCGRRVWVTDWAFAASGAAWLDAALIAPRLVQAGHTPEEVDELLCAVPSWQHAPPKAVAGLAALWTLHRLHEAEHGQPGARAGRARSALAGQAWMVHCLARLR